ncbi:hypothetical protein RB195_022562 [Necator americanus]|uniref:Tetratricopeptide repeat protein n=1 Tax=Necator americanus TaxID=51031 RepID=A0ABR1EFT0_NECAM
MCFGDVLDDSTFLEFKAWPPRAGSSQTRIHSPIRFPIAALLSNRTVSLRPISQQVRPCVEKIAPTIHTPPPFNMDWMRAQDVMPTFTIIETTRFFSLSSLDFNNCYSNGDPRRCAERGILFKANRVLEARLDYLTSRRNAAECGLLKSQIFHVYTKLGHVAVLAQDWVKALSAYQEAYKVQPLEFWEDPGAYYGLGLVYIHFKEFKLAADSFSRLLYSFPNLGVIVEVKARLGVCYQNLGDYNRALKFYNQALSDSTETPFLSKTHIRFNIALSSENAGDLSKAEEEYKKIVAEVNL